jgi:hypothetical protein
MPPFLLVTRERHPLPGARPAMSPTTIFSRKAVRSLPCHLIYVLSSKGDKEGTGRLGFSNWMVVVIVVVVVLVGTNLSQQNNMHDMT